MADTALAQRPLDLSLQIGSSESLVLCLALTTPSRLMLYPGIMVQHYNIVAVAIANSCQLLCLCSTLLRMQNIYQVLTHYVVRSQPIFVLFSYFFPVRPSDAETPECVENGIPTPLYKFEFCLFAHHSRLVQLGMHAQELLKNAYV